MKTFFFSLLILLPFFLNAQNPPDTIFQHWHNGKKVSPTESKTLLRVEIFDFHRKNIPNLPVSVVQLPSGQVWHGKTGPAGKVLFLVPKGKQYRIDAGTEQGLKTMRLPNAGHMRSSYGVVYVADEFSEKITGDTIVQEVSPDQAPTRSRVLVKIQMLDFDDEPLVEEALFFATKKSGKVYLATTDENGKATLMLPKADTFCLSTCYVAEVDCTFLEDNEFAETLRLNFHTIGTAEFLRRKAVRERLAAVRDSLFRVRWMMDSISLIRDSLQGEFAERNFMRQISSGHNPAEVEKLINKRATKERELIAEDPQYFEKAGDEIKAVLYRMRSNWTNKVIVTDVTGSMYPFMDQLLLWHALQLTQGEDNRYLFFNDGDDNPDNYNAPGNAGGIYHTDAKKMRQLMDTMKEGISNGGGGDSPENDMEALMAGVDKLRNLDELILIADNYSDVWDIKLLEELNVPVHIILAGADYGVNEQYLEIAYRTGGSIHTLRQDIQDLAQLADGQSITIGTYTYRVSRGKFIQVEKI